MAGGGVLMGTRLKLLRASECLDATFDEARRHDGSGAYFERVPNQPDTLELVWRVHEPLPPMLGVMLGEAVHNLRTAMDHLVWQAVLLNGEQPTRSNQFPIADTSSAWDEQLSRLRGVTEPVFRIIQAAQPYHRGKMASEHPLAVIRDVNNTDKHRTLPALHMLVDAPKFQLPEVFTRGGATPDDFMVERMVPEAGQFPLKDGKRLLRISPRGLTSETHPDAGVGMQPQPLRSHVAFEYGSRQTVNIGRLHKHLGELTVLVDQVEDAVV